MARHNEIKRSEIRLPFALYERVRAFADGKHISLNDALIELLTGALDSREQAEGAITIDELAVRLATVEARLAVIEGATRRR